MLNLLKEILNDKNLNDEQKVKSCLSILNQKIRKKIHESLKEIIKKACSTMEIGYKAFFSKCRNRDVILARKLYIHYSFALYRDKFSIKYMANQIGINHATYLHHLKSKKHYTFKKYLRLYENVKD